MHYSNSFTVHMVGQKTSYALSSTGFKLGTLDKTKYGRAAALWPLLKASTATTQILSADKPDVFMVCGSMKHVGVCVKFDVVGTQSATAPG